MRFPVSFAQQRLWFLDQLSPGEPTYLMPYAMWLDGPLDADALQRALDALVARHGVLRTSIVAVDGVPEQVVADSAVVTIERVVLPAGLDGDERVRRAESIAAELATRPFDLAKGPLLRASLIEAGPDRHLFVLVMHHAISDGQSMQIVVDELSALYRAQLTGEPVSLPERWMDYGDYAVWQHDRLRGEELERQLAYWREQLRGAPDLLALPTERPRPARQSSAGAVAMATVSAATTARLAELAHRTHATTFMTFLTGFAVVLSRYAHQTDLVIGTPVAGRTHVELDPIVGMFTNTVALRTSLAGDPSFAQLLGRVRDVTVDAVSHQELPFEKLVEELAPDRTLAHTPLLQVQFAHQSLTAPGLDLPGVTARSRALVTGSAKLDLTLYADAAEAQATTLVLEYSTDLFDADWAQRFLACVTSVLDAAAHAPDTPVGNLPLLSASDRAALLRRYGVPAPTDPGDEAPADVRTLLRASTSTVFDGAGGVPAAQVCERAARLARTLADRGVGPEQPVGLCADRGTGMLTGLLAIWWAGGAYVPLDPAFPPARLAAMAGDADLAVVVCDEAHAELAATIAPGAAAIRVDDPAAARTEPLEPVPVTPGGLAYVIFTSGSTGQPKGVGIEHRAVGNLLASFRRLLGLGRGDRFVAVTTLSFDIALLELLLPLVCGADLVIAGSDEAREPDRLRALLERAGASAMQATPQTWRLLLAAGGVPAGLRLRLCGGEALPRDLADQLAEPGTTLWNLYGPTETTVWSAAAVVPPGPGAVPIGAPIGGTRIYVLDERGEPVPVGVVGEVCLAGRGVARGYHNRPRLTARSFRPDPFGGEPGARLYRTGDLGRWRRDGGLELIGRTDHQIKIRGFRIECGEVEAVLRSHRDVRQAAVVAAERAGEPALVAYVVPRRSAAAGSGADLLDALRPRLRAALPEYMLPELVVVLPALPLTPNGKVDRAALPAPDWGARPATAQGAEPRNPVEATLARMWGELLGSPTPVGVHDNLFDTGAHSLTATRFVARVADTYGVALPLYQVFAGPTVAELAKVISADPAFGREPEPSRHPELDGLSDDELDALLRAAIAQRNRRQAAEST